MRSAIVLSVIAFVILQGFVDVSEADCPAVSPVANFNAVQFAGRWYEIRRYKTVFSALTGNCAAWNFTVNNANTIGIALSTLIADKITKVQTAAAMKTSGVLNWKFTFGPRKAKFFLVFR